jgi:hypothetical protein
MDSRANENKLNLKKKPNLIKKLEGFLGPANTGKALKRYELSLNSSGPVVAECYIKNRHPWWDTIVLNKELSRQGKSIHKNLSAGLMRLAEDASIISTLQKHMPECVREKYKSDLLDDENARNFMFEIKIAWHYFLRGFGISWYEEPNCPEFKVTANDLEFDIECKSIGVDSFRKIGRKDFYYLVEICIKPISDLGLSGLIEIYLDERLPANIEQLKSIADEILRIVKSKAIKGGQKTSFGSIKTDLKPTEQHVVDLQKEYTDLWQLKPPQAHGVIFAGSSNKGPIDPIKFLCQCNNPDSILSGIRRKLVDGAERQLSPDRPGFIACFIPEIDDFKGLEQNSGLLEMTGSLFKKDKRNHIIAISFSSDIQSIPTNFGIETSSPGVIFRNPYTNFEIPDGFQFINEKIDDAAKTIPTKK